MGEWKSILGLAMSTVLKITPEKSSYEGFADLVMFIVRNVVGSYVYHVDLVTCSFSLSFKSKKFVNLPRLLLKFEILACVDFKNLRDS